MRRMILTAALLAALAGPAAAQAWHLTTDVDPIDDAKTVAIARRVELGGGQAATLRVSCAKGLPRVSVSSTSWIGRGRARAQMRFDQAPAESDEWIAAGPLAGPDGHGAEVALIRRLLAARTFALRLDFTRGGRAYMATVFVQLGGFAEAFAPVGRACNWAQLYADR